MNDQLTISCRPVNGSTVIMDLAGDFTRYAEEEMLRTYQQVSAQGFTSLLYNFTGISNINSSGIAVLIGIVSEARRKSQKLIVFGLTDHYIKVFNMIGLPKYIDIVDSENQALGVVAGEAK